MAMALNSEEGLNFRVRTTTVLWITGRHDADTERCRMTALKPFREQSIPPWRRAVLKVGSSLLAASQGGLSTRYALGLAQFITTCHTAKRKIVLVSSGAVAAGRMLLKGHADEHSDSAARQAMAALGQTQTVALWQRLLDRPLAQVLLTHDDLRNRRRYLNAQRDRKSVV